jgi:hypothetical protein
LFVAELDANGTLTGGFATVIGGTGTESANGVAVDGSGNIYVVGQTASTDLFSSPILPPGGSNDAFVFQLASGGGSLNYATYLGGSNLDLATGVAVNGTNAFVSGITDSPGLSTNSTTLTGTGDNAFVAEFNSTGTEQYFTYVNGTKTSDADAIAVDSSGVAYITGKTTASDLPSPQNSLHGTQDAFVTKINTDGTIAFSTYLGGATPGLSVGDEDEGLGIALNSGNIFVTGITSTKDFPVINSLSGSRTLKGASDAFVTEFAASGATPVFSTFFGGSAREDNPLFVGPILAGAIAVDSGGNVYITGNTNSPSNFPLQNPFQGSIAGGSPPPLLTCGIKPNTYPCPDAFVAKITP